MKSYLSLFLLIFLAFSTSFAQTVRVITPVGSAEDKTNQLTTRLSLNATQQAKVNHLMTRTANDMRSIESLEQTAPAIYNMRKKSILLNMDKQLKALLSSNQIQAYESWHASTRQTTHVQSSQPVVQTSKQEVKMGKTTTQTTSQPSVTVIDLDGTTVDVTNEPTNEPVVMDEEEEVYESNSSMSGDDDIIMKSVDFLFNEILRPAIQNKRNKKK